MVDIYIEKGSDKMDFFLFFLIFSLACDTFEGRNSLVEQTTILIKLLFLAQDQGFLSLLKLRIRVLLCVHIHKGKTKGKDIFKQS